MQRVDASHWPFLCRSTFVLVGFEAEGGLGKAARKLLSWLAKVAATLTDESVLCHGESWPRH